MKTTKLVQANTIAFSSSAMFLYQHGSTRSTRSTKSNMSSRVETSQVEFGPKLLYNLCRPDGRLNYRPTQPAPLTD